MLGGEARAPSILKDTQFPLVPVWYFSRMAANVKMPSLRDLRRGDAEFDQFVRDAQLTSVGELVDQLKREIRVAAWSGDPKLTDMLRRLAALRVSGAVDEKAEQKAIASFVKLEQVLVLAQKQGARAKRPNVLPEVPDVKRLAVLSGGGGSGRSMEG